MFYHFRYVHSLDRWVAWVVPFPGPPMKGKGRPTLEETKQDLFYIWGGIFLLREFKDKTFLSSLVYVFAKEFSNRLIQELMEGSNSSWIQDDNAIGTMEKIRSTSPKGILTSGLFSGYFNSKVKILFKREPSQITCGGYGRMLLQSPLRMSQWKWPLKENWNKRMRHWSKTWICLKSI